MTDNEAKPLPWESAPTSPCSASQLPDKRKASLLIRAARAIPDALCTSRFHPRRSPFNSKVRPRKSQFVCTNCRQQWSSWIAAAPSEEESRAGPEQPGTSNPAKNREEVSALRKQKGLRKAARARVRAARSMLRLARSGVISLPQSPGEPGTDADGSRARTSNPDDNSSKSRAADTTKRGKEETAAGDEECRYEGETGPPAGLSNALLLPEIRAMVVSNALDVERRCAIELVAPGWRVCERANPRLEEAIEFTSIVTYTRGSELGETGTFSRTYGHDDADHIWLPIKRYDGGIAAVNSAFRADVRRALCQEGTHVFRLGAEDMIDDLRGGDDFLITDMNDCFPLRGRRIRDILPFDDESPAAGEKKLAFQGGDRKRFEALKHLVVQSPLEVMGLDARGIAAGAGLANNNSGDGTLDLLDRALDLDRAAALYLSWSRMPLLESLVLDLRIYSHDLNRRRGCLRRREVVERAAKMGRHLRLKLLVIAGLRSYDLDEARYYYDDAGATTAAAAADVESRDRLHGQPNWIKLFLPALRPGGRIVLVDRVGDQAPELPWSLAEIDNFAIVGQLMEQR